MYDADWNLNNENLCFAIYGGLMVDETGERFMNEQNMAFDPLVYSGQAGLNNGNYYVLVDGEYYDACVAEGVYKHLGEPDWNFGREMFYPVLSHAPEQFEAAVSEGWAVKGDTIAECAEAFGLTNLEETVKRYNEFCQSKEDADFGKDPMFLTEIKDGKSMTFGVKCAIWVTCALLYALQVTPVFYRLANGAGTDAWCIVGAVIMLFGVCFESAADIQKQKLKKINPKRFCDTGLFRIVRCPNYLGEMLFWTGVLVSGANVLRGWQWLPALLGYLGIVFVMFSGARRLELRQNKSYGADLEYQAYVKSVPILLPFVPLYSVAKYKFLVA